MSYILDALKKAERDRLREDPKELDDFASSNWDPYEQKTESSSVKYLALVIGFLALLLALVIYSGSLNQAPTEALLKDRPVVEQALTDPEFLAEEALPATVSAGSIGDVPNQVPAESVARLRQPLPKLTVSGQMYLSEGSPSNRLFAGQRTFRVGDKLDQHWTLVAINLQNFDIRSGDQTATLPYR
tara:strand:+ start:396 stop:953 length:558 start_codon:yes stop_codon:yes gene_type:complete